VSAARLLDHMAILKGITNRKERQETVDYLLHQVNLYEARHKAVSGYSGGMRQRFGIAQALLGKPRVIIVDEPTAGLDPAERVRFLNLLSQIGEQAAIILSTHIVEDVSDLCPEMAIISAGQVILIGQPLQLMQSLKDKVWQVTIAREQLPEFEARYQVVSTRFFMGKIVVNVFNEEQPQADFEPIIPDLKDVYFCALKGWLQHVQEN
jgi:ABC-type multidrug transport system ATPase subunit